MMISSSRPAPRQRRAHPLPRVPISSRDSIGITATSRTTSPIRGWGWQARAWRLGSTGEVFSDHTDVRPTMISLAGLRDDYSHDGRVLFEVLDKDALPHALHKNHELLSKLAAAYKAINAPRGELGRRSLKISTRALTGDATTLGGIDDGLNDLTARRNAIASRMIAMLEAAAFDDQAIDSDDARHLIDEAQDLLAAVRCEAGDCDR